MRPPRPELPWWAWALFAVAALLAALAIWWPTRHMDEPRPEDWPTVQNTCFKNDRGQSAGWPCRTREGG